MNHLFSIIWSRALNAWVVASELAVRRGGRASARRVRRRAIGAAPLLAMAVLAGPALAELPGGGRVVVGEGHIGAPGGGVLTIDQASRQLAIDWQRFDIGPGNTVRFNQPGADAVALNRVLGADASTILGRLQANGRVFLINPNGVLFGEGAQVDVGGLVASTLDIANDDFAAGRYRFQGDGGGAIVNRGRISAADGGAVALLGGRVSNQGLIQARLGSVALAAGNRITLDFAGDGLLKVQVDAAAKDALVENHQLIQADGGQVLMTAEAGAALLQTVVNNTGVIEARTLANRAGRIVLLGGFDGGTVAVAGTLDASAPAGGDGGFIDTSGHRVAIDPRAAITTAAPHGDTGTWLIDPNDYTIAAAGGDVTGALLSSQLEDNNITIRSIDGATAGNGDIFVNDDISWISGNRLTLEAVRHIEINATLINSDFGSLVLRADVNGTGIGSVSFGSGGDISLSGGRADLYHNVEDFAAAPDFSARISGAYTQWMLVHDLDQLQAMQDNLAGAYALGGNIDASATAGWNDGAGFAPVGTSQANPFTGRFDGLGHAINGLTIERSGDVGLFGTAIGATIRNVGINGGSISGDWAGALVGNLRGGSTVSHSYATAAVTGQRMAGGLVGYSLGGNVISDSYATGEVASTGASGEAGGLVAYNNDESLIERSWSSGAVTGNQWVGGLVGRNEQEATVVASFWDSQASGRLASAGSAASAGKTTAELMQAATYTAAGWDFSGDWWLSEGNTRPFLRNEYGTSISNAHQLQLMALDLAADYRLDADIDAAATAGGGSSMWSAAGFEPIGDTGSLAPFTGSLDGLGHRIDGLAIDRPGEANVGLFDYVEGGLIRNLGLTRVDIEGNHVDGNAGGIAGLTEDATISGVFVTGSVSAFSAGGLVGFAGGGAIGHSYAAGTVAGEGFVGGLVGYNGGAIDHSYATGAIASDNYGGGLVGFNEGDLSQVYATGDVTAPSAGGLIGSNAGSVSLAAWMTSATSDATAGVGDGDASGITALDAAAMTQAASFAGWDIATEGGSSAAWRLYEGHSMPLLRAFMTDIAIAAADVTRTYDGTAGTMTGYVAGDPTPSLWLPSTAVDAALIGGTATVVASSGGVDAGSYDLEIAGGLYSGQHGYDIDYAAGGKLTITPAQLTASGGAVQGTRAYDGTRDAAATSQGSLGGTVFGTDTVALQLTDTLYGDKNVGAGKAVTGRYVLAGADAGNYVLADDAFSATADITAAQLTASGGAVQATRAYDGSTAAAVSSHGALAGVIGTEEVTVSLTDTLYGDKNVGTGKAVTGRYVLAGDDAGNYALADDAFAATADITAAQLTASGGAVQATRVYDGSTAAAVSSHGTLAGVIGTEEVTVNLTDTLYDDKNVGTDKTVTGRYVLAGADAGNYALADDAFAATADITPRAIAVVADDLRRADGEADPPLTWRLGGDGLAVGDSLDAVFSGALSREPGEAPGRYAIRQGSLASNDNYRLVFSAGVLEIEADPDSQPAWPEPYAAALSSNPTSAGAVRAPQFDATVPADADADAGAGADGATEGDGVFVALAAGDRERAAGYRIVNGGLRLPEDQ